MQNDDFVDSRLAVNRVNRRINSIENEVYNNYKKANNNNSFVWIVNFLYNIIY